MAFVPKTYDEIVRDAITYYVSASTNVTDFNPGSVIRTLLEAFALEYARLNGGITVAINEAQENAAYTTFGFNKLPAARAYGTVQFTRDPLATPGSTVRIPRGTTVSVGGSPTFRFSTVADVTLSDILPVATVTVVAALNGALYNVGPNAIDTIDLSIGDVQTVTNPRSFITGADPETDLARRERFAIFLQGLHRATQQSILYGVKQAYLLDLDGYIIERVVKAATIEQAPGLIYTYIHNGSAATSIALLNQATNVLNGYRDPDGTPHEGWKAAGIQSQVFIATEIPQGVDVSIEIESGRLPDIVKASVQVAVDSYFQTLDVGDALRIEPLKQAIRRTPGVLDIVTLANPPANVVVDISQYIVRGVTNVTVVTG